MCLVDNKCDGVGRDGPAQTLTSHRVGRYHLHRPDQPTDRELAVAGGRASRGLPAGGAGLQSHGWLQIGSKVETQVVSFREDPLERTQAGPSFVQRPRVEGAGSRPQNRDKQQLPQPPPPQPCLPQEVLSVFRALPSTLPIPGAPA